MSHFTKLAQANVVSKSAFIKAAAELGFTSVKENTKVRGYMGNEMVADVVVAREGCQYDIGLVKNGDKYDVISDWWGVRHHVPDVENKLSQLTAKHTIVDEYASQGFFADVQFGEDENLTITLTR